jgi:hypothetical integral membrane protein (TIGR02206 family)
MFAAALPVSIPDTHWLTEFRAFSALHLVTVLILAVAMAGSCTLGVRWKGTKPEWRLRLSWAVFTMCWNVVATAYYLSPGIYEVENSLPLHVCDIAVWVAPLALLTQARWLRTLLYFFGIGLSTQAFVTPVVDEGVAHVRYWLFWVGHTQIVGSAIYDVGVLGYRPRFRDVLVAGGALIAYAAAIMPLNLWLGVNYGYVGNTVPEHPTIIDRLGPWPWRLLPMTGLALGVFVLAWAVWPAAGWVKRAVLGPANPGRRRTAAHGRAPGVEQPAGADGQAGQP